MHSYAILLEFLSVFNNIKLFKEKHEFMKCFENDPKDGIYNPLWVCFSVT